MAVDVKVILNAYGGSLDKKAKIALVEEAMQTADIN